MLAATAPSALLDVKVTDVIVKEVEESRAELSCTAKEAYEMLNRAMRSACLLHDITF